VNRDGSPLRPASHGGPGAAAPAGLRVPLSRITAPESASRRGPGATGSGESLTASLEGSPPRTASERIQGAAVPAGVRAVSP
jgi:hypothetical protein